jgi:hypothetical protein
MVPLSELLEKVPRIARSERGVRSSVCLTRIMIAVMDYEFQGES